MHEAISRASIYLINKIIQLNLADYYDHDSKYACGKTNDKQSPSKVELTLHVNSFWIAYDLYCMDISSANLAPIMYFFSAPGVKFRFTMTAGYGRLAIFNRHFTYGTCENCLMFSKIWNIWSTQIK